MAHTLNEFTFSNKHMGRRYPWKKWTDGQIWKAEKGNDFTATPVSFQTRVHVQARKMGLKARTKTFPRAVVFQFYRPSLNEDET